MAALSDRFELLGELGRGAMGVVYRARERSSGREVALKVLAQGALEPELALRARREAEALGAVRHPGIITVFDAGLDEGRPWLACELVEEARPLDRAWTGLDRAARTALVRDVARALGHAHARGVVHRDVKPGNVLVGRDGRPRLADFGLARVQGAEALTATGTLLGTPAYMAPEQLLGDRGAVGPWTDVWALGVLLYEAVTERRPFAGSTVVALAHAVLRSAPTAPRALDPTISRAVEEVALRALRADPRARLPDGEAFAAALDVALRAAPDRTRRGWLTVGALALVVVGLALALGRDEPPSRPALRSAAPISTRVAPSPPPPAPRAPVVHPRRDKRPLVETDEETSWFERHGERSGPGTPTTRQGRLGRAYLQGELGPGSRRAVEWLEAAIDAGDEVCLEHLAEGLKSGRIEEGDRERALDSLRGPIVSTDPEQRGSAYIRMVRVLQATRDPADAIQARDLALRAAEEGFPHGKIVLAEDLLAHPPTTPSERERARELCLEVLGDEPKEQTLFAFYGAVFVLGELALDPSAAPAPEVRTWLERIAEKHPDEEIAAKNARRLLDALDAR